MLRTGIIGPFVLLLLWLTSAPALAAGVGFTPGRLELSDAPQGTDSVLYVINTGSRRSNYRVYAGPDSSEWFDIAPAEFVLDPNEHMAVEVRLSASHIEPGQHETTLRVVAFSEASERAASEFGAGARVPVRVSILSLTSASLNGELPSQAAAPHAPAITTVPANAGAISEPNSEPAGAPSGVPSRMPLWIGLAIVGTVLATFIGFVIGRRRPLVTR